MESDSGIHLDVLKVDGGVTLNSLCMQIQADTLGIEVIRPVVPETTALGAAYAAGLAVGFWDSPDDLRDNWQEDRRWTPQIDDEQRQARVRRLAEGRATDPGLGRGMRWTSMYSTTSRPRSGRARRALRRLADEQLDVLVIGAGVTGAGAALDAVTRGLRVGLVEARDFAAGTSSRSSKLFHGGLRYLEQLELLPWSSRPSRNARWRSTKLAPHLAKPVPFLYPLTRPASIAAYAGLGIGVYDVMGAGRGVPSHLRHLGRRKTLEIVPVGQPGARARARSSSTKAWSTTPGTP